jgi:hypothetical protein
MKQFSFLATDPTTNFRIGVICKMPVQCRCGENLTTISSSRGPHAGALLYTNCGRNRKWLSREEAKIELMKVSNQPAIWPPRSR